MVFPSARQDLGRFLLYNEGVAIQIGWRRILVFALLTCFVSGCGGRAIGKKNARDLITGISPRELDSDDVEIESVGQTGGGDAVIQARVKTAFRVEKVQGRWVVREVKIGTHQWEKLDTLLQALDRVKGDQTRGKLDRISAAMAEYVRKNGRLPEFKNFIQLSDALYPLYMNEIIRNDAWDRPFSAERLDGQTARITSMGPDGKAGTPDDIVK
jgi:hypothetical protein